MEPATIAVITASFLGFCIWIERREECVVSGPDRQESVFQLLCEPTSFHQENYIRSGQKSHPFNPDIL